MASETILKSPIYRGSKSDFCGPTAIAAVTGESLEDVRAAIHQVRGEGFLAKNGNRMPITGMTNNELLKVMVELGWRGVECAVPEGQHWGLRKLERPFPKLKEFCQQRGSEGPFIVNVTGHYIAVGGGEVCDTRTRFPIEIERAMKRTGWAGAWVRNWWRFERQPQASS
jgi:hypothetical protein